MAPALVTLDDLRAAAERVRGAAVRDCRSRDVVPAKITSAP